MGVKAIINGKGKGVEVEEVDRAFLGKWLFGFAMKVLVNGVPTGFFSSSKGLRQGDPLSPYLFIMGMEVLSVLITRAVEGGFISGCSIWRAASGLKMNLDKSEVIPVGEVEEVNEMAVEIGYRVGQLPAVYLGLPLGPPNKATSVWKRSMPLYQMSLFRMPKSVARRLEKLQRDFLWGGCNGEKKVHLVNWEVVCVDKEKGGLGLRKLARLNKALLGKWIWRFACAKEDLWKKVLEAKYGQEDFGWRTRKANGVFGVGVWKKILKESDWCWENMAFKECHGGRNVGPNIGQDEWNLRFLRDFNDWELDMVGNLLDVLREHRVTLEEDSVIWKEGRDGLFRVKKAYNMLASPIVAEFLNSNIWVDRVPTKIAFFAWEAA
ncbi:putative ribonuclease H protein [Vitis vinifera]|uniref:Putative ribonuclease H protein n=1 Tax=Vitis vinifera TaxID=29760 RepID=A0A438H9I1_VITVI|nr:putative ribonuclease H protein [Vitis vinifera]